MKKFLLGLTMASIITTQTQAVRMTDLELIEELFTTQTPRRAASQASEFVNDRDSVQFLRNIAEGSGKAMFVIPVVVLLLSSGHAPQKPLTIVLRSHNNPSGVFPSIVKRPTVTAVTLKDGMPQNWGDMEKIWHHTFGPDLPEIAPEVDIRVLPNGEGDVLPEKDTLQALKASQRALDLERRDNQKRLKRAMAQQTRAMAQQTKSHAPQSQDRKRHKASRFAGQSMKQLKHQNGR